MSDGGNPLMTPTIGKEGTTMKIAVQEMNNVAKTKKLHTSCRSTGMTRILRKITETVYADNETLVSSGPPLICRFRPLRSSLMMACFRASFNILIWC